MLLSKQTKSFKWIISHSQYDKHRNVVHVYLTKHQEKIRLTIIASISSKNVYIIIYIYLVCRFLDILQLTHICVVISFLRGSSRFMLNMTKTTPLKEYSS